MQTEANQMESIKESKDMSPGSQKSFRKIINSILREAGIGLALIVMVIIFSFVAPYFFSLNNLKNIFTQITVNTILAVGMTYVILTEQIDLSVGSVMALAACTGAIIMKSEILSENQLIWLGMLACILVGIASGWLNGFVTTRWNLPSFIVTIGILNIARGAALLVTNGRTIFGLPFPFVHFGSAVIWGVIPVIFLLALLLIIVGQFVLSRTVFGRFIFAIGNNEEAVRLSGHNTSSYKVAAFVISGFTAGIAAIVYMARLTVAQPIMGNGFELNAIAAVIIGGTSLQGGKGSLTGTLMGACLMGILTNGLILMGVGDFVRQMVTGLIIILAVIFDKYRQQLTVAEIEE